MRHKLLCKFTGRQNSSVYPGCFQAVQKGKWCSQLRETASSIQLEERSQPREHETAAELTKQTLSTARWLLCARVSSKPKNSISAQTPHSICQHGGGGSLSWYWTLPYIKLFYIQMWGHLTKLSDQQDYEPKHSSRSPKEQLKKSANELQRPKVQTSSCSPGRTLSDWRTHTVLSTQLLCL